MARKSTASLYPDVASLQGEEKARAIIQSYKLNREAHRSDDEIKAKCLQYVHGIQFTDKEVRDRAADGLPSTVVDETLGVWATLDGWARGNQAQPQFVGLGKDDPAKAQFYNKLYIAIRTQSPLQSVEAEAFGTAVIEVEAFSHVFPRMNSLGHLEPDFECLGRGQCYPDANAMDRIDLNDAEFIDLPVYMTPAAILRTLGRFMDDEFRGMVKNKMEPNLNGSTAKKNALIVDNSASRNGQYEVVRRYYKMPKTTRRLIDGKTGEDRVIDDAEAAELSPEVAKAMGFEYEEEEDLVLWRCVFIPELTETKLLMDKLWDFQPWNVLKNIVEYPVKRLPHKWVGRRPLGAIRSIISLQDSRNLIISSLQLHIQTAANGGFFFEADAFPDPEEERAFKEDRNHGAASIKTNPGALEKKKIQPIERGSVAFNDFGQFLESVLLEAVRKSTGAEPVMQGQSQKGAPATLYKQQVEQSQNKNANSADNYRDWQYANADLVMAFVRQHYTEHRVLMVEGASGFEPLEVNVPTIGGILNDPAAGLYTVRKTSSPNTPTARRQRLADDLEIAKTFIELGAPAATLDWESLVDETDSPPERKEAFKQRVRQWMATQGIGAPPMASPGMPGQAPVPPPQGQPTYGPAMPATP